MILRLFKLAIYGWAKLGPWSTDFRELSAPVDSQRLLELLGGWWFCWSVGAGLDDSKPRSRVQFSMCLAQDGEQFPLLVPGRRFDGCNH
jgi:hypothetical protein